MNVKIDLNSEKIKEFRYRNKKPSRNRHLYDDNLIEGYDYIKCPILGERMSMIKSSYVEKVLGLKFDDYKAMFPDIKYICDKRVENIKNGLTEIDTETGLTKHQAAINKAVITKKEIGDDGLTIDQKVGMKTKETHMNNIDENGLNGYQRIAAVARPKQHETMAKQGKAIDPNKRYEWESYRWLTIWWSQQYYPELLGDLPTGKMGEEGAYQIDHKYTIFDGFNNGISPFIVGHKKNLEPIIWEDNANKGRYSTIALNELLHEINITSEDNEYEYSIIMTIIDEFKNANLPRSSGILFEEFNRRTKNGTKIYKKHQI